MLKELLLSTDLFVDAEWLDKYVDLIEKNRTTSQIVYETEQHHIIPKFIYHYLGQPVNNLPENLVNLYYADHLLAHFYLAKSAACEDVQVKNGLATIFLYTKYQFDELTETKLIDDYEELQALIKLTRVACGQRHSDRWASATDEERAAHGNKIRETSKNLKTLHRGDIEVRALPDEIEFYLDCGFTYGRSLSSCESISKSKLGTVPWNKGCKGLVKWTEEQCENLSKVMMGHPVADDVKERIGNKNRGKIYIHRDEEVIKILPEELDLFQADGWSLGNPRNIGFSGKKVVHKDGIRKTIPEDEYEQYLRDGWKPGTGKQSSCKGRVSPTAGKIRINNGVVSKFVTEQEYHSFYPEWMRGKVKS